MTTSTPETVSEHCTPDASVDLLPLAVLLLDDDLRAVEVNSRWEELSGRSAHDSRGALWWRSIDARDRAGLRGSLSSDSPADDLHVEHRIVGRDGERWTRWWWQRHGDRISVCVADVDAERSHAEDLWRRATHDPLTGLSNRTEFMALLERALDRSVSHPTLAVAYVDLDRFKAVNDAAGHRAGDAVLAAVAHAIVEAVRPFDVVARLGGDEFAVLCPGLTCEEEAAALATRIRTAVAASEATTGIPISASVGVAVSRDGDGIADALVDRADREMYRDKAGRTLEGSSDPAPRQPAPGDADHLPSVLVPMLFRVGLSLHAVADAVDLHSAAQLRDVVEELDDVIASLRRSALAHARREIDGPSVRAAFTDLESAIAAAERAVGRAWVDGASHADPDVALRLVRSARLLRAAERALDPDVLG